ncbi:tho complex subunit 7 [Ophiostoma piceae UAMH 11346]|uniref:Tho complex subunit 7 n=1 Tax=Ophiostoma piceae (strain UAMH 11346) TaxID=1262450 RepID=S3BZV2_OPHP1|nr:tho complex subunit 7 [Ophiostoma piceae UAMH 11346]
MAYQLLDPREEEELFKTRLLNVEEKPFKRITKRLALLSRVAAQAVQEQTPPPDSTGSESNDAEAEETKKALAAEIAQLREDVTLDFAAFDSSIARLQFLGQANTSERARYAERRQTVEDTCGNVRSNMLSLREQLEQARATLVQRQAFDVLADRITSSKTLWPRADQEATILKLEDECRQLQGESETYLSTWRERKQQFARIMDESMKLRRQIRDEADEVERREGMDEEGEGEGAGAGSQAQTLAQAADTTPVPTGAGTEAASTPTPAAASGQTLAPEAASFAAASREATPAVVVIPADDATPTEDEDMAMVEDGQDTPAAVPATPLADTPEGTPADAAGDAPVENTEKMDTT